MLSKNCFLVWIFLIVSTAYVESKVVTCPTNWTASETSETCLFAFDETATWQEARNACKEIGADLVTILDNGTNNVIGNLVKGTSHIYWIGLYEVNKNGTFVWARDNSKVNYTNWSSDDPNNKDDSQDCVETGGIHWGDTDCSVKNSYICEVEASSVSQDATNQVTTQTTTIMTTQGKTIAPKEAYITRPNIVVTRPEIEIIFTKPVVEVTMTQLPSSTVGTSLKLSESTVDTQPKSSDESKSIKNPPAEPKAPTDSRNLSGMAVASIVIAVIVALLALTLLGLVGMRYQKRRNQREPPTDEAQLSTLPYTHFDSIDSQQINS